MVTTSLPSISKRATYPAEPNAMTSSRRSGLPPPLFRHRQLDDQPRLGQDARRCGGRVEGGARSAGRGGRAHRQRRPAAGQREAVRRARRGGQALVRRGVAADRLAARGDGQGSPTADNRTEDGGPGADGSSWSGSRNRWSSWHGGWCLRGARPLGADRRPSIATIDLSRHRRRFAAALPYLVQV